MLRPRSRILFGDDAPKSVLRLSGANKSITGGNLAEGRTSSATFIDTDGLLKTASANVPVWENGGLRHEEAATNYFRQSSAGSITPWSFFSCARETHGSLNGLMGGLTVTTLTSTGVSSYSQQGPLTVTSGATVTHARVLFKDNFDPYLSIYDNAHHQAQFILTDSGSTANVDAGVAANIKLNSNGSYTCSLTYTITGTSVYGALFIGGSKAAGSGAAGKIINQDIAQLEAGIRYSSYIPTTTAAVTRATCALSVPLVLNQNFFQKSAIVMRVRAKWANSSTAKSWLTPSTTAEGLIDNGSGALTFKDSAANTATADLTSWAADTIILVTIVTDNVTGLMSLSASKDNGATWIDSADTAFAGMTVGANWLLFSGNTQVFECLGWNVIKSNKGFAQMKAYAKSNALRLTQ
jgi:hypothetical protein